MARPATITDERILAAAREVFLEKGITATTAMVARRAKVAEGSLFNRFPTKRELFTAAMRPEMEDPEWLRTLDQRVGAEDVAAVLEDLGLQMVDFFRRLMPLMMMCWSNPGPKGVPDLLSAPNPPPLRALKRLAGFFEAQMRAGALERHDPEIVARAFLGGVQNYVFFEILLRAQDEMPLAAETYIKGLVALLGGPLFVRR
jgi:AcrR family transcriptional regulator